LPQDHSGNVLSVCGAEAGDVTYLLLIGRVPGGFMSIDQIACEALKLDSRGRAVLAETIWASLEEPYTFAADLTDAEAIQLAKERDQELEKGLVSPLSHDELMSRLRA
jgi:hypothetical protein